MSTTGSPGRRRYVGPLGAAEEFDRLLLAAERLGDPNFVLLVLLGGEAGLRRGELRGLEWKDVDLRLGSLTVARRIWGKDDKAAPKSGKARTVPLVHRLEEALAKHRHLRGPSVLCTGNNTRPGGTTIASWLSKVQIEAGLKPEGPHILRHTFCSHLAMRGVPINTIKNWAGHAEIKETERYMHLSPTGTREALEVMRPRETGDMLETAGLQSSKSNDSKFLRLN